MNVSNEVRPMELRRFCNSSQILFNLPRQVRIFSTYKKGTATEDLARML